MLDKLITEMLDNACGSLSPQLGELEKYNGGFQQYVIETHCVGFKVNARKNGGVWEVRDWQTYDC